MRHSLYLLILVLVCFAACSEDDAGGGGSTATGGSAGSATGGSAGSTTGGSGGEAGSGGAGGAGGEASSCGNGVCDIGEAPADCSADCPATRKLDLLLVVDNGGDMSAPQSQLLVHLMSLQTILSDPVEGLPSLHVGVVSTDLGTAPHVLTGCEQAGGDAGNLQLGACAAGSTWPFMIYAEPEGCTIDRDGSGHCTGHDCTVANCAIGELDIDEDGCPRCQNLPGGTFDDSLGCLSQLGTFGCGFEQPLEAMKMALDGNPYNGDFLRDDSVLAVLFFTTEDDCSASNSNLFDDDPAVVPTLGPLTSFRCFEWGVTCDVDDRDAIGTRNDCTPRSDQDAMLHPIARYVDALTDLRDPGQVVLAGIAGPVVNSSVDVQRDLYDNPTVQFSCTIDASTGGTPAIRILNLIEQLTTPDDLASALQPICDDDWAPLLSDFTTRIKQAMH